MNNPHSPANLEYIIHELRSIRKDLQQSNSKASAQGQRLTQIHIIDVFNRHTGLHEGNWQFYDFGVAQDFVDSWDFFDYEVNFDTVYDTIPQQLTLDLA